MGTRTLPLERWSDVAVSHLFVSSCFRRALFPGLNGDGYSTVRSDLGLKGSASIDLSVEVEAIWFSI